MSSEEESSSSTHLKCSKRNVAAPIVDPLSRSDNKHAVGSCLLVTAASADPDKTTLTACCSENLGPGKSKRTGVSAKTRRGDHQCSTSGLLEDGSSSSSQSNLPLDQLHHKSPSGVSGDPPSLIPLALHSLSISETKDLAPSPGNQESQF